MIRVQCKSFRAATDAQSLVISALLILGLILAANVLYLAINVPIEAKKYEFQHASEVIDDFTVLDYCIESLARADSAIASVSVPIRMAPAKDSLVPLHLSSGTLSVSPTEETITVIVSENGTDASDTWTDDDFVNTSGYDVETSSGNVTLSGPPYITYPLYGYIESNMAEVSGNIGFDTGSNSTCYGIISWHEQTTDETEIIMMVRTSIYPNMTNATDWYTYSNGDNLSSISPTLNGHRYVQYRAAFITQDPSYTPTLMNISINYSSITEGVVLANSSGGSIIFASNYKYLPNHKLVYENNAVIKSQTNCGLVCRPFNISVTNASGIPRINISLINLTGTNVPHYSGAYVTFVRFFRNDYSFISDSFIYPNVTLKISSEFPSIWSDWFNKTLTGSNLTHSVDYSPPYVTNRTVAVELYGHGKGVQLYLEETTITVEM